MKWSVIVCCYNSEARIAATVQHVAAAMPASCELLLVDNRCTDRTVEIFHASCAAFGVSNARVVFEPEAGLIHARRTGVREARGEFLAFIDDDNLVGKDYFACAERVLEANPEVWVFGCATALPPATQFPSWIRSFLPAYAVGRQGKVSGVRKAGELLWGAGMVLRAAPLHALFRSQFVPLLVGRTGARQLAGDDSEMAVALELMGGKTWYENKVLLEHAIDPSRFTVEKLASMYSGFGACALVMLRYILATRGRYPQGKWLLLFLAGQVLRDAGVVAKDILVHSFKSDFRYRVIMRATHLRAKWSPDGLCFARFSRQDDNLEALRVAAEELRNLTRR